MSLAVAVPFPLIFSDNSSRASLLSPSLQPRGSVPIGVCVSPKIAARGRDITAMVLPCLSAEDLGIACDATKDLGIALDAAEDFRIACHCC